MPDISDITFVAWFISNSWLTKAKKGSFRISAFVFFVVRVFRSTDKAKSARKRRTKRAWDPPPPPAAAATTTDAAQHHKRRYVCVCVCTYICMLYACVLPGLPCSFSQRHCWNVEIGRVAANCVAFVSHSRSPCARMCVCVSPPHRSLLLILQILPVWRFGGAIQKSSQSWVCGRQFPPSQHFQASE